MSNNSVLLFDRIGIFDKVMLLHSEHHNSLKFSIIKVELPNLLSVTSYTKQTMTLPYVMQKYKLSIRLSKIPLLEGQGVKCATHLKWPVEKLLLTFKCNILFLSLTNEKLNAAYARLLAHARLNLQRRLQHSHINMLFIVISIFLLYKGSQMFLET